MIIATGGLWYGAFVTKSAAADLASDLQFSEKQFYLDEFRGRTLVIAAPLKGFQSEEQYDTLGGLTRELLRNDTRVLLLFGGTGSLSGDQLLRRLQRRFGPLLIRDETLPLFPQIRGQRGRAAAFSELSPAELLVPASAIGVLTRVWSILRAGPLFVGAVEDDSALFDVGITVAQRFGVHKLVLVEAQGGIAAADGQQISFMNEPMLATVLQQGEAEWAGLAHRRPTLQAIEAALRGGVASINLCALDGLARELFTYEGSGTLFTLDDYCRVERLRIDEFEEVERLIERGQREGFLKFRQPDEIGELLLSGYGATIGTHHLAGICALVITPYTDARAGEIVGLYTITRFKGEGVGPRLIQRVLDAARAQNLRYVFACTIEERAQVFFERQGFKRVGTTEVPATKWEDYDPARRAQVAVYRLDLERPAA
jgi:amino-acid N-acetyltransferase